jgi:hypothetical protein
VRANIKIHALTNSKTPAERLIGTLALAARINAAHAYRVMWKKTTNANLIRAMKRQKMLAKKTIDKVAMEIRLSAATACPVSEKLTLFASMFRNAPAATSLQRW